MPASVTGLLIGLNDTLPSLPVIVGRRLSAKVLILSLFSVLLLYLKVGEVSLFRCWVTAALFGGGGEYNISVVLRHET